MKLLKSKKVDMSHQFKSEGMEWEVYNIMVIDFLKWKNVLGRPKSEKWTNKLEWMEYYNSIYGLFLSLSVCACLTIPIF